MSTGFAKWQLDAADFLRSARLFNGALLCCKCRERSGEWRATDQARFPRRRAKTIRTVYSRSWRQLQEIQSGTRWFSSPQRWQIQ